MSTATAEKLTREEWLELRRKSLGASEAAAALGVSPYQTPVELWQRKVGLIPDQEESEAMRWGSLLEPVILGEYARRTGRRIVGEQGFTRHPGYPCLTATPDAVTEDGRLVEVKTASAWAKEWGDEDSDEIPDHYLIQVAHQMAVTGAEVADVAVLIGGQRLRIYTVPRDESLVQEVVRGGLRFWEHVERQEPPTWGRMTPQTLAVRFPECHGEAEWSAEDAAAIGQLVTEIEMDGRSLKLVEERLDRLKALVLERMGNAQVGRLPDGRRVKRFLEHVAARDVSYTSKAYTKHYFRVLKGER